MTTTPNTEAVWTSTSTETALNEAVTRAIARTDTGWALNRPKVMDLTRAAVMAAIEPIVNQALSVAHIEGVHEGVAQGRLQGRSEALLEAATMLKRHGHRSAVTRVQALAQTPARPRPVNANPAGGPGLSAPEGDVVAPEPTEPENGAQRGEQGLQGAIDAASDAERERPERDAWVGHAPTSPRPRTYAARLAAAGDEAPDD